MLIYKFLYKPSDICVNLSINLKNGLNSNIKITIDKFVMIISHL